LKAAQSTVVGYEGVYKYMLVMVAGQPYIIKTIFCIESLFL